MTVDKICVDASILLKLVLGEEGSAEAAALVTGWSEADREMVAPSLLPYELASTLFKQAALGRISEKVAREGVALLKTAGVRLYLSDDLDEMAWQIGSRCGLTVLYDAYYLALAELLQCDYWTADARFARATAPHYPSVRLLGATGDS